MSVDTYADNLEAAVRHALLTTAQLLVDCGRRLSVESGRVDVLARAARAVADRALQGERRVPADRPRIEGMPFT